MAIAKSRVEDKKQKEDIIFMSTKITKKVVMYLAAVLVLLTLVCMCLLGNTYARYTTGTKGTADAELSLWSVTKTGGSLSNSSEVAFDTDDSLSPNQNSNNEHDNDLYNMTSVMQVAAIKIETGTEVDVKVNITATADTLTGSATYYDTTNAAITSISGTGITTDTPSLSEVKGAVKMYIGYFISTEVDSMPAGSVLTMGNGYTSASYSYGTSPTTVDLTMLSNYGGSDSGEITWTVGSSTTYIYVYAWVTWTTAYTSYSSNATDNNGLYYADLLDTWIGANISAVKSTISVVAVQNSQNPTS